MALTTLPVEFGSAKILANLSTAVLVEMALARGEGQLAANGALQCDTGERTGRSPDDKFLEDSPAIHNNINWGKVNQPVSPEHFEKLKAAALAHLATKAEIFRFDGYAGADPNYRLKVRVFTEKRGTRSSPRRCSSTCLSQKRLHSRRIGPSSTPAE